MTLLYFDGFQDYSTMRKPEWVGNNDGNSTGRDGSTNGAASFGNNVTLTLPSAAATAIVGFALAPVNSFQGNPHGVALGSGGTAYLTITTDSGGYVQLRRGNGSGTVIATATINPILNGSWRHVAIKAVLHTTTGSAEVQVDGVTVINFTGQTSTVTTSVSQVIALAASLTRFILDDLYVCDAVDGTATDGRANNNFLGDLVVKTLLPTAAGDSTQLTPSTGANWAAVDEVPPNTTDFVSATAASALKDQYTMSDLPANASTVYAVKTYAYANKSDAGAASLKAGVKEGSTVTVSAGQSLTTTYAIVPGTLLKKKPSDGTVFTPTDVNNLQSAIEVS